MTDFQDRLRRIEGAKCAQEVARSKDPEFLRKKRKTLKARRRRVSVIIGSAIALVLITLNTVFWRDPVFMWLYANGVLPQYGAMLITGEPQHIGWDRAIVDWFSGAGLYLVGHFISLPFVRLFVR